MRTVSEVLNYHETIHKLLSPKCKCSQGSPEIHQCSIMRFCPVHLSAPSTSEGGQTRYQKPSGVLLESPHVRGTSGPPSSWESSSLTKRNKEGVRRRNGERGKVTWSELSWHGGQPHGGQATTRQRREL